MKKNRNICERGLLQKQDTKILIKMKLARIALGFFGFIMPLIIFMPLFFIFNIIDYFLIIIFIIYWILSTFISIFFFIEGFKLQKWKIYYEGICLSSRFYIDIIRFTIMPGQYYWDDIIYIVNYPSRFSPLIVNILFVNSQKRKNLIYGLECRNQNQFNAEFLKKTKFDDRKMKSFQSFSEYLSWKKHSFNKEKRIIEISDINEGSFIPPL